MKLKLFLTLSLISSSLCANEGTWNLIDKSMDTWKTNGGANNNKAWTASISSKSNEKVKEHNTVTQEASYVNVTKTFAWPSYNYAFLVPPAVTLQPNTAYSIKVRARINPTDKTTFPDVTPPSLSGGEGGFEANQISARINNRNLALFIKYGDDQTGYLSPSAALTFNENTDYRLNTSEWHDYRFVLYPDNLKFDVYIDDLKDPIFEAVPTTSMSGTNILRLGAESNHRCNMDIEYAKLATGDFYSTCKITNVSLSSDSHIAGQSRSISITANTALIADGTKLLASLVDANDAEVVSSIEAPVSNDRCDFNFTIPATVTKGNYFVKVAAVNGSIGTEIITPKLFPYTVTAVSPLDAKMLPQVSPVCFPIEIQDYQYQAVSKEFIFPAIIDVSKHTTNGKFKNQETPLSRYYRFYTPHENPGGMFLATGPTLDGPWTERNTVMTLEWAKATGLPIFNGADHISACQVVWNTESQKFFMYFHGPNTTTHYALSDNLRDWTYGGIVFNCKQFSTGAVEASYAKVFEHAIPELGNKYVALLMIMQNNIRKIYWAHSTDGIAWTTVTKPLISPDLSYKKVPGTESKPDYSGSFGNNIAGPFLFEKDGRYFVFVNGSSGNIFVIEVGESFDQEIHWGVFMKASDVVIDTDVSGEKVAVPRIAAPVFIQNDEGLWYMFFEAGSRLGANIAYAKEKKTPTSILPEAKPEAGIIVYPSTVHCSQSITIQLPTSCKAVVNTLDSSGININTHQLDQPSNHIAAPPTKGIYFLHILTNDGTNKVAKIVVTQ